MNAEKFNVNLQTDLTQISLGYNPELTLETRVDVMMKIVNPKRLNGDLVGFRQVSGTDYVGRITYQQLLDLAKLPCVEYFWKGKL